MKSFEMKNVLWCAIKNCEALKGLLRIDVIKHFGKEKTCGVSKTGVKSFDVLNHIVSDFYELAIEAPQQFGGKERRNKKIDKSEFLLIVNKLWNKNHKTYAGFMVAFHFPWWDCRERVDWLIYTSNLLVIDRKRLQTSPKETSLFAFTSQNPSQFHVCSNN